MASSVAGIIGATLGGSLLQSRSANRAADAQEDAADRATELQREIYYDQQELNQPLVDARDNALAVMMNQLGLGPGISTTRNGNLLRYQNVDGQHLIQQQFGEDDWRNTSGQYATEAEARAELNNRNVGFEQSPGYQFRLDRGNRAVEANLAANGMSLGGNALKAISDYNQGMASQEEGTWWNRLAGITGMGQTGANNTQAAGTNFANSAGQNILAAGQARGSAYQQQGNIIGQGINSLAGTFGAARGGFFGPNPGFGIQVAPAAASAWGF